MNKLFRVIIATLCIWAVSFSALSAEPTAADRGFAAEEFRLGVQAFYRGSYNDAILMFEKALSFLPNDSRILEWLGNSYYQSGIEGAAIQYWEDALKNNYTGDALLLQNKIDLVNERRVTGQDLTVSARYVEAGSFPGSDGKIVYYNQPISALPEADGSCWVVAYGSNELLHFDVNGLMTERIRGPVNGFDRPMDIIRASDGSLLISEYAGDRISMLSATGRYLKSFGTKGRGVGELLGPQYMDTDESGNIYVTDFGNARVCVFNSEGEGLFTFGTKTGDFDGLQAPSGIAVLNDCVYVADAVSGTIYMFDYAGNYLDVLVPLNTFVRVESLKHWESYLLVADSNKVYSVDTVNGAVLEVSNTGNAPSRITCAVPDQNGNILVTDFKSNEIYVMSKMSELVGGFSVHIDKVSADSFPTVVLDVRVENRQRKPVVGLGAANFLVTEGKRPVSGQLLTGIASQNDALDVALVIDRSESTELYRESLQSAVRDIASAMNGRGTLHLISAGEVPVLESSGNPQQMTKFNVNSLKTPVAKEAVLDLSVRLAVNRLIPGERKRAVIFITAGTVSRQAFNSYGLADLTAYMGNNGVSFATVNLSRNQLKPEISFLTHQTGGGEYYVYRPDGISMIVDDLLSVPVGSYRLRYTSSLKTDFGRAFLPVEVESYLLNRSGRTESGYFAPLE